MSSWHGYPGITSRTRRGPEAITPKRDKTGRNDLAQFPLCEAARFAPRFSEALVGRKWELGFWSSDLRWSDERRD